MNKPQPATIKVNDKLLSTISAYLLKNGSVKIIGLGIFKLKRMPEVPIAYNPHTKQKEFLPAYTKLVFTPTFQLKEKIKEWK